jgi:hypothetical protein
MGKNCVIFPRSEVSVGMISNPCIEVQTTSEKRFSVPVWFAEVVIIARYLEKKGRISAFARASCAWWVDASEPMNPSIFSRC